MFQAVWRERENASHAYIQCSWLRNYISLSLLIPLADTVWTGLAQGKTMQTKRESTKLVLETLRVSTTAGRCGEGWGRLKRHEK